MGADAHSAASRRRRGRFVGGEGQGHGAMVAVPGAPARSAFWRAVQAGAPAGILSVMGAWRLQPTRLRVWLCRPSPLHSTEPMGQATANTWASSRRGNGQEHPPPNPLAHSPRHHVTTTEVPA